GAFSIGYNGTNGGAGSLETDALATTGTALECMAAGPGSEPDTGTLSCTCDIPALGSPALGSGVPGVGAKPTDQATFGCCGVAVDKEISCNAQPVSDAPGPTGVSSITGTACV